MKTVTFYSYKGGVGRSLTLSNMAKKLVDYGLNVFVIDFDLEAPGLTYKFKDEIKETAVLKKKGIVDYISHFQETNSIPQDFEEYYTELKPRSEGKGKMHLMTAGQFKSPEYWDQLGKIDWIKLFEEDETGVPLLLDLKGRIKNELNPDFILIDSRTGVTPTASITLKLLADRCVILAVNNEENIDGAGIVLESLMSMKEEIRPELYFALTRIPYHNENDNERIKEKILIEEVKGELFSSESVDPLKYFGVIHHEREQGWKEEHKLGLKEEKQNFLTLDYLTLFDNLFPEATKTSRAEKKLEKEKEASKFFDIAFNSKDLDEQIYYYTKVLDIDPKEFSAYNNRARAYFRLGYFDLAINDLTKVIEYWPDFSTAYSNRALCYSRKNETDFALKDNNKAIDLNPSDGALFLNRGTVFHNSNQLELALKDYNRAIDLGHESSTVYNNRANIYRAMNSIDLAFRDVERALKLNSKDGVVWSTLSEILLSKADKKGFYEKMNKAVSLGFPLFEKFLKDDIYNKVKKEKLFLDLVEKSKSNTSQQL
ncbi:MAG: tetratricopeptide repeat protein [Cyclobacteriaceae bacterium]